MGEVAPVRSVELPKDPALDPHHIELPEGNCQTSPSPSFGFSSQLRHVNNQHIETSLEKCGDLCTANLIAQYCGPLCGPWCWPDKGLSGWGLCFIKGALTRFVLKGKPTEHTICWVPL